MGTPKQMPGLIKANFLTKHKCPRKKEIDWAQITKTSLLEFTQIHSGTSCGDAHSTHSSPLSPKIGGSCITQLINEGFTGS